MIEGVIKRGEIYQGMELCRRGEDVTGRIPRGIRLPKGIKLHYAQCIGGMSPAQLSALVKQFNRLFSLARRMFRANICERLDIEGEAGRYTERLRFKFKADWRATLSSPAVFKFEIGKPGHALDLVINGRAEVWGKVGG